MSGLRTCAECDKLFRIENDGPEAMRRDGTFPRHVCHRCSYLKEALEGFDGFDGFKTSLVKTGAGMVGHVIVKLPDTPARVLSLRWVDKERLVADVSEEESGKVLHEEVSFTPGGEDLLEPLVKLL